MRLVIAVTDNDWYWQLRSRPLLEEVNLWQPGGGLRFQGLASNELVLFKPHTPHHSIVGGGFFLHSAKLPCSLAWEIFERDNGASSLHEMRRRIERFRHLPENETQDYQIGCTLLQRPFFFDEVDWIPLPADFSKNVATGKLYDSNTPAGNSLWNAVRSRLQPLQAAHVTEAQNELFGEPTLVGHRLGPGGFRLLITDIYERKCAVTGDSVLPVLQSVHIRPVDEGGLHRIDNGLLLRSDVRRLFQRGYLAINHQFRVVISPTLTRDYEHAEPYAELDGREIFLPAQPVHRPRREFLQWHMTKVFRH